MLTAGGEMQLFSQKVSTLPCEVPSLTFRANSSVHSAGNIHINDTEQLLCIRSCAKSFTCYLPDLPKHYISQVRKLKLRGRDLLRVS